MSTLAERIVTEAEGYVGTPFLHQGRLKGLGIDCAHFVANVINAARANTPDIKIPHDYRRREDGTIMMGLLGANADFVPTEERQPGDVLALCDEALRFPGIPRHLAFVKEVTPKTTFIIHASEHGVRSHRMDARWMRRIHSVWRAHE